VPLANLASAVRRPCLRLKRKKKPGRLPARAFSGCDANAAVVLYRYAALPIELMVSLIGSAASVATFLACSARTLACAVIVSNCARI
jgi:hypothetical protein